MYVQLVQNDMSGKGRNGILDMGNFLDTTNIDGRFDFSEWVRAYGRYLDEALDVWSKLAFFAVLQLVILYCINPSLNSLKVLLIV